MKTKIIALLIICLPILSFSQIINPKNVFKRKAEQRANQKIDQSIDSALDKLFAPPKKDKNTEDSTDNTGKAEKNDGLDISGIMGAFNMGGTPKATYSFSSSMTMKMTINNPKEKQNFTMRNKYMFSDDMSAIGIKFIGSDNPEMSKASAMMDAMVMDMEQKKMFTFMNNDGKKTMMGMGFKGDDLSKYVEEENDKIVVTKTTKSKTIAGHTCTGYTVENPKDKSNILMWVSNTRVGEFAKLAASMSSGSSPFGGAKMAQKNYMAYNAHPEFVKMAQEGRMILGFSGKGDNGETTDMEFEEIKANDKVTFNTGGYKSMF